MIDTATLKGQSLVGTLDLKTITRLLRRILKVYDVDDLLQKLFQTDELIMQRTGTPAGVPGQQDDQAQEPDTQKQVSIDLEIAAYFQSIREALAEN